MCELLWREWSPTWKFTPEMYAQTAASFDNPDFVDVVIHSYRVRYGYVAGDLTLARIEEKLAAKPTIAGPAITLQGEAAGTVPPEASIAHAKFFTGQYQRRTIPRVGHNIPAEAPHETAAAVLELLRTVSA